MLLIYAQNLSRNCLIGQHSEENAGGDSPAGKPALIDRAYGFRQSG
jgi:hypothetical protein